MANIGVKPAKKGMNLVHPVDGPLPDEGGSWREDQFTLKRLRDKDIKRVEAEADDADAASDKPSSKRSGRKANDAPSDAAEPPAADPVLDPAATSALVPAQE